VSQSTGRVLSALGTVKTCFAFSDGPEVCNGKGEPGAGCRPASGEFGDHRRCRWVGEGHENERFPGICHEWKASGREVVRFPDRGGAAGLTSLAGLKGEKAKPEHAHPNCDGGFFHSSGMAAWPCFA
jgi:hypothetical protein